MKSELAATEFRVTSAPHPRASRRVSCASKSSIGICFAIALTLSHPRRESVAADDPVTVDCVDHPAVISLIPGSHQLRHGRRGPVGWHPLLTVREDRVHLAAALFPRCQLAQILESHRLAIGAMYMLEREPCEWILAGIATTEYALAPAVHSNKLLRLGAVNSPVDDFFAHIALGAHAVTIPNRFQIPIQRPIDYPC